MKGEELDTDEYVAGFAAEWLDMVTHATENLYRDGDEADSTMATVY